MNPERRSGDQAGEGSDARQPVLPLANALLVVLTTVASATAALGACAARASASTVLAFSAVIVGLAAVAGVVTLIWRFALQRGELERLRIVAAARAHEADEQRRLHLLGTLAAGLAHELGQPLSAARVGIEGIHYLRQLGREPSAEHLARTLSRVGLSIVAMTQTIEHLRGLAGPAQPVAAEPVDLGALVEALLAERGEWLRYSDTRIAWTSPPQPVLAEGDPAGIRLILANLLRNAVEAVAGQGEERRVVRIAAGPGAMVAVHDSGPGLPPDRLALIFDPFHTTKAGPGRGIGLSLAKASAERMGAELRVESRLGVGTVFTLVLRQAVSAARPAVVSP